MALSRQALGFLTLIIIIGGLGTGMYFRLRSDPEETQEDSSSEVEGVLPEAASQQFATDVPQPVVGAGGEQNRHFLFTPRRRATLEDEVNEVNNVAGVHDPVAVDIAVVRCGQWRGASLEHVAH